MSLEKMSLAQLLALHKAVSKTLADKAKEDFQQGTSEAVDMLVRVVGAVKKGKDSTMLSWPRAKWDLLAGIFASNVNEATRNKVGREYAELMEQHETAEEKEAAVEQEKKIKAGAKEWHEQILAKTEIPRKGTVTAKLDVTLIEEAGEDEN